MEGLKTISFAFPILFLSSSHLSFALNSVRSLKTGDTFTPGEMLPVALKLMEKVKNPGLGKGIVSASKNAEDLADKLFESFFLTDKRYVTLTENDINGLNALQALALNEEVPFANNYEEETVNEESVPQNPEVLRGRKTKGTKNRSRRKYKLLTKKVIDKVNEKRRGLALAKKLSKKRRLIVKGRRELKEKISGKLREPPCVWRYECSNLGDIDTCRLHTRCIRDEATTTAEYIGARKQDNVNEEDTNFGLISGASILDEEVEKIMQTRFLHLKKNNLDEKDHIESLGEYFNKIIIMQSAIESATAVTDNYVEAQLEGSNEPTEGVINDENSENTKINDENSENAAIGVNNVENPNNSTINDENFENENNTETRDRTDSKRMFPTKRTF